MEIEQRRMDIEEKILAQETTDLAVEVQRTRQQEAALQMKLVEAKMLEMRIAAAKEHARTIRDDRQRQSHAQTDSSDHQDGPPVTPEDSAGHQQDRSGQDESEQDESERYDLEQDESDSQSM
jgi:hypothetical protein